MIKHIRLASDIHLEHCMRKWDEPHVGLRLFLQEVLPQDDRDKESLLVLAGDITGLARLDPRLFLQYLSPRFEKVVYIPGNHEFYGYPIEKWEEDRKAVAGAFHNVTVTGNGDVIGTHCGEFTLFATTLWTQCGMLGSVEEYVCSQMIDFKYILKEGHPVSVDYIRGLSTKQVESLQKALEWCPTKSIVATHHLPSFSLCDPRFGNGPEDSLFASNYDRLLSGDKAPVLWMHGHTHARVDRKLGDTWVRCNPAGYPGEFGSGYERNCFIDLCDL